MKKNILLSKTFWLNIVFALAPAFSDSVQAAVQEHTVTFGIVWGALAVLVRMVTKDKVVLLD